MAIDLSKGPEEQEHESTGPILDRPLPNNDEEIFDANGYEPLEGKS